MTEQENSPAAPRSVAARELANRTQASLVRAGRWLSLAWPQAVVAGLFLACAVSAVALGRWPPPTPGSTMANAVAALLLQVGAAFVGATTIAFTLVMFAMQVNVERMPYGLFRRFSGDLPLMGAFGLTFVLSMGVAALSLVGDPSATPWLLFGLFWTTVSILGLFLFAYRRALRLISPAEQLQFVVRAAQRDLQKWDRRAARITRRQAESVDGNGGADLDRVAFFLANRHWTDVPRKAVEHAIATHADMLRPVTMTCAWWP